jgi:hypothetical protein
VQHFDGATIDHSARDIEDDDHSGVADPRDSVRDARDRAVFLARKIKLTNECDFYTSADRLLLGEASDVTAIMWVFVSWRADDVP